MKSPKYQWTVKRYTLDVHKAAEHRLDIRGYIRVCSARRASPVTSLVFVDILQCLGVDTVSSLRMRFVDVDEPLDALQWAYVGTLERGYGALLAPVLHCFIGLPEPSGAVVGPVINTLTGERLLWT